MDGIPVRIDMLCLACDVLFEDVFEFYVNTMHNARR